MKRFLDASRTAATPMIDERRFVGIDDAIDVYVHDDNRPLPEMVALEAAIDVSRLHAVGFSADQPVPAGYAVGFIARWLSEYRDLAGRVRAVDRERQTRRGRPRCQGTITSIDQAWLNSGGYGGDDLDQLLLE